MTISADARVKAAWSRTPRRHYRRWARSVGALWTTTNEWITTLLCEVVSQQTAEALAALDLTVALTNFFIRLDDLVAKALMISFRAVRHDILHFSARVLAT